MIILTIVLLQVIRFVITATFSEPMDTSPSLSLSGLITDELMTNSGDPSIWT